MKVGEKNAHVTAPDGASWCNCLPASLQHPKALKTVVAMHEQPLYRNGTVGGAESGLWAWLKAWLAFAAW